MQTPDFLPDGPWEGFYEEYDKPGNFPMACTFTFVDGSIAGSGSDELGPFTFAGTYTADYKVTMRKRYHNYGLIYHGHADENGIWGRWVYPGFEIVSAGFHLWPKKGAAEVISEEAEIEEAIEELLEVDHPQAI